MSTKRCYRSKNGMLLGVCKGIAEWKDFPVGVVRLIFLILLTFGNGFPIVIIYLVLALVLPVKGEEVDEEQSFANRFNELFNKNNYKTNKHYYQDSDAEDWEDFDSNTKTKQPTDDEIRRRFERLKNRVSKMENDLFDKEKNWDERFKKSNET